MIDTVCATVRQDTGLRVPIREQVRQAEATIRVPFAFSFGVPLKPDTVKLLRRLLRKAQPTLMRRLS